MTPAERRPKSVRAPRLRPATSRDAEAIRAIYNDAVATLTATFDTEPRSPSAQRRWMAEHRAPYSVIVAELGGRVVGWASLSAWSAFSFRIRSTSVRGMPIGGASPRPD